jgi:hypothetical protein
MASRRLDADIDRLYQLPLDEFTTARNTLAKDGGADVRALRKPPVAAWAVNQLYWKARDTYDALVEAAEAVRKTHTSVLAGKGGDLRSSGKAHDQAVEAALKATMELLAQAGHPGTDATRQAVLNTLRALPADEPPGRLTRVLQPGGFEMLAGMTFGRLKAVPAPRPQPSDESTRGAGTPKAAVAKLTAKAREAIAKANRDLRQAEHTAKRLEFDAARAAREAEKAERQAADARAAFETAEAAYDAARESLEEAEAAVPPAERAKEAAARRSREADEAVEAARAKLQQLTRLQP